MTLYPHVSEADLCCHHKMFFKNKFGLKNKPLLNCVKYRSTTADCVDTTMFSHQATVLFSKNRDELNGSVFARGE